MPENETNSPKGVYVRRGGVYLIDDHAGVMIDSAGNFVAKTRGEPRALAAMLRLIADDLEEGAPRLAREWDGERPKRAGEDAAAEPPAEGELEWMVVSTVASGPTQGRTIATDPLDEETAQWLMASDDEHFTRVLHRRVAAGPWQPVHTVRTQS